MEGPDSSRERDARPDDIVRWRRHAAGNRPVFSSEVIMSTATSEAALARRPSSTPAAERPSWLSPTLFPFQSRFVSADGTRFHYVDEGQGPPLLFLHGGPMSSFMWRHPLGALRQRYRCVAVDLPGLGLSRTPLARGRGFERMADALEAFVRAIDLEAFTLIVHATGAPSGLEMAVRNRARVRGLAISNTFAWPIALDPGMRNMVRVVSSPVFSFLVVHLNLLANIAARRGRRHGRMDEAERAAVLGPYQDPETRAHLANLLLGLRTETPFFAALEERLPLLASLPALLVFGEEDNNYKAGAVDHFARLLPRSEAVVIPGAAHFLTEDAPAEYTRVLGAWLARQPV
jgi:haloalkane dehalogenase